MKIKKFLCILLTFFISNFCYAQSDRWDENAPSYPFFSNGLLKECKGCDTFAIIATERPPQKELIDAFRKISTLAGKSHQGVLLTRIQLLSNLDELISIGCAAPPGITSKNVVYFVDRNTNACPMIVYESSEAILPALETIYANRNDPVQLRILLEEIASADQKKVRRAENLETLEKISPALKEFVKWLITRIPGLR